MQSADDVQFRDAELQGFPRLFNDLLDGQLEAVGVAFLARERAELARQDAVVRVVDVAVDDVAGAVANFFGTPGPRWRRRRSNPSIQTAGAHRPRKCVRRRPPCRTGRAIAALNEEIHLWLVGGTGLRPVVSGVAPETTAKCTIT
jgi:hypothetical protein